MRLIINNIKYKNGLQQAAYNVNQLQRSMKGKTVALGTLASRGWLVEQGLTPHSTQFRSFHWPHVEQITSYTTTVLATVGPQQYYY